MNRLIRVPCMALAMALILCAAERPAHAASFLVTTLDDYPLHSNYMEGECACVSTNTVCSLRAAVQASNRCADSVDYITLQSTAGIYRLTIATSGEDQGATGDVDILVDPTYGASGAKTVIIDFNNETLYGDTIAGFNDRLFDIPASAGNLSVSIIYGSLGPADNGPTQPGGCIQALAGSLDLSYVDVDSCVGYFEGGALYAEDALLSIDHSTFTNNYVAAQAFVTSLGGAISTYNTHVSIDTTEISANIADNGAGIHVRADQAATYFGSLYMDASTVTSNSGYNLGGGIALYAPGSIDWTTVSANTVNDTVGRGAGIYVMVADEDVTVDNCTIEENYNANAGGGIFADVGTHLLVWDTVIEDNYDVTTDGGGVAVDDAEIELAGCTIDRNHAAGNGGGVSLEGSSAIISTTGISDNTAANGGGLALVDATADVSQSGFAANSADYGGAIFLDDESAADLVNVSTSDNGANEDGGAVYSSADSSFIALHSSFWLDMCLNANCDVAGIFAGDTTYLDRSILLAETSSGTYDHCDGSIHQDGSLSDASACFNPDVVDDDEGLSMCGACNFPVVAIAKPSKALSGANPCGAGVNVDARGASRNSKSCDIGAYEQ